MVGSNLKQTREQRQLTLREVEWATKIRADYLDALEDERWDALPAPVYARGFLRTYATYLGLDPEPMIAEYNAAHAPARQLISTRPPVKLDRPPRFAVTPAVLGGLLLFLVAAVFVGYVGSRIMAFERTGAVASTPSPPAGFKQDQVAPSPSPLPVPSPSPSVAPINGVQVALRVDAPVWVRVEVDGKPADATGAGGKVLAPGATLTFTGNDQVHVRTGKASHTFVTVNGKDQGAMKGDAGDVGDATFKKAT
jgi:cytoskeletal protein RodZ